MELLLRLPQTEGGGPQRLHAGTRSTNPEKHFLVSSLCRTLRLDQHLVPLTFPLMLFFYHDCKSAVESLH